MAFIWDIIIRFEDTISKARLKITFSKSHLDLPGANMLSLSPPGRVLTQPAEKCWTDIVTYVGATSANDVGPTCICPSVQCWHNVVTPPTMTLCQRFANVITYCILLYLMVGITFAQCLYEWLAKRWHNFIIAHCLSTITIKITTFIWKAVA